MNDLLFALRVRLFTDEPCIMIYAYDANRCDSTGHNRIDVVVRQGGKTIFARGDTWCATSAYVSIDGIEARELVMSLVAMKPGDTDEDYFAGYTSTQLEWVEHNGDALSCESQMRYCDENGNVRKASR